MFIRTYDYITGKPLATLSSLSSISFGDNIQNQHCSKPQVIRAESDEILSDSSVLLFLEDKGSWKSTQFGYYVSSDFTSSIESGSPALSNHFIETSGATVDSPNCVKVPWDRTASNYVWLDCHIYDATGIINPNYRLFYSL